jgi:hypothetical protein
VQYVAVSLGPDAVPDLIDYLPRLTGPLQQRLHSCLLGMYRPTTPPVRAWYEWSYRRNRLESTLHREYVRAAAVAGSLEEQRASCYR